MSKLFRKTIKFMPQILTMIGAISVAFAMLLSLASIPVQASDSRASNLQNNNNLSGTFYSEENPGSNNQPNIVPPTETIEATPPTKIPPAVTPELPTPTVEPPTPTVEPPTPTVELPTPTVEAPTPTVEAPTPTVAPPTSTPTEPGTNLTPDVPVVTETPDPGETPQPPEEPTLAPPTSNEPPTILIPVTGSEVSNQSPLGKIQTTLFNMGIGLLGLGLVLQSISRKFKF